MFERPCLSIKYPCKEKKNVSDIMRGIACVDKNTHAYKRVRRQYLRCYKFEKSLIVKFSHVACSFP